MHEIYLYKDLKGDTFDWDLDIEMFTSINVKDTENLREELIYKNIGFFDLKYLDANNKNKLVIEDFNIIVWDFNDNHFDWLIKDEVGKIKFIETINNKGTY